LNGGRGLTDHIEHRLRLRKHRDVAARQFNGRGTHTLRYEAFQIGMDGPIILADDIPARLSLPCRAFDLLREQVGHRHGLRCPDEFLLRFRQISCEIPDAVRFQPDPAISDLDVGEDVGAGKLLL
jgi:hypothetical protein